MKVVKFGGTSLGNVERVKLGGKAIKKLVGAGERLFVVVSAMGEETDTLIGMLNEIGVDDEPQFVAIGELKSARFLSIYLRSIGVSVFEIEPGSNYWPIVVDNEPMLDLGKKRIEKLLSDFPDVQTFVLPGFLCVDPDGKLKTLGRGGSDISAFIIGKLVNAEEVIIVTDVEGVYSVDPYLFPGEKIKEIHADRLSDLSAFGARVIHPEALKYKDEKQKSKIIHYRFGDLEYEGTYIFGEVKREVFLLKETLSLVTIHRDGLFEELDSILKKLPGVKIFGINTGVNFAGFYVKEEDSEYFASMLLKEFPQMDITIRNMISAVVFKKESPKDRPGLVSSILDKIKKHGINLVEISSIGREVQIFVEKQDSSRVIEILKKEESGE